MEKKMATKQSHLKSLGRVHEARSEEQKKAAGRYFRFLLPVSDFRTSSLMLPALFLQFSFR
jgi:hypothetical protein